MRKNGWIKSSYEQFLVSSFLPVQLSFPVERGLGFVPRWLFITALNGHGFTASARTPACRKHHFSLQTFTLLAASWWLLLSLKAPALFGFIASFQQCRCLEHPSFYFSVFNFSKAELNIQFSIVNLLNTLRDTQGFALVWASLQNILKVKNFYQTADLLKSRKFILEKSKIVTSVTANHCMLEKIQHKATIQFVFF